MPGHCVSIDGEHWHPLGSCLHHGKPCCWDLSTPPTLDDTEVPSAPETGLTVTMEFPLEADE